MDLESLLGACKSLSDEELLELKGRMDALAAHRDAEKQTESDADAEFLRKQKQVLKSMVTGKADKIRLKTEKVRETPEQKKAREQRELAERKKAEAERERLELGDTGPKLSKAEQQEQARLNTRKAKAGIRQTKNGASKHKVRPAASLRPVWIRECVRFLTPFCCRYCSSTWSSTSSEKVWTRTARRSRRHRRCFAHVAVAR